MDDVLIRLICASCMKGYDGKEFSIPLKVIPFAIPLFNME